MAREFSTAGDAFSQILQRELEVDWDEAEKLKITYGLLDPSSPPEPGVDPSMRRSILMALRPVAERLVSEVQRSVAFTQENRGTAPPGKLLLTGGGARLQGLDRMLAETLEIPVEIWPATDASGPPSRQRKLEKAAPGGAGPSASVTASPAAVCLGAACEPSPINLLSPSSLLAPRGRARPGPAWVAVGYALALAGVVGWLWLSDRALSGALAEQEARLAQLAPAHRAGALDPYLLGKAREAVNFKSVFDGLDRLVKEGMRFDSIALKRQTRRGEDEGERRSRLRVEGTTHGEPAIAERTLANFLESIEASPVFRNVQLVRSTPLRNRDTRGLRFTFTTELQSGATGGAAEGAGANSAGSAP
jgi:hypothetical protein